MDHPEACRGGSAPALRLRIVRPYAVDCPRLRREHRQVVHSRVWRPDWHQYTFLRLRWRRGCLDLPKIAPQMVGCKDHTDVSTTNIIKPTMETVSADGQHHFDDLIRHEEEVRQLAERYDKEEEVLRQLNERREKALEKYLSYFTVDRHRHQKIIHRGEIDMTSLLPPP
jgi:hypothetical protein